MSRGKLVLKGSKGSKSKSSSVKITNEATKVEMKPKDDSEDDDFGLTTAEKRHNKRKLDLEQKTGSLSKLANSTFRERMDEFNTGLSKLTEHNDLPRISAAGNG
jgi:protein FAM32A